MKYMYLVYHEEKKLGAQSQAELDALMGRYGALVKALEKGGHHVFSAGRQSVPTGPSPRPRSSWVGSS